MHFLCLRKRPKDRLPLLLQEPGAERAQLGDEICKFLYDKTTKGIYAVYRVQSSQVHKV